jgi:hypothetical protein
MPKPVKFAIYIPNYSDPEASWETYDYYESYEAAIKAAKHHFGADDEGRINIVSELSEDEND